MRRRARAGTPLLVACLAWVAISLLPALSEPYRRSCKSGGNDRHCSSLTDCMAIFCQFTDDWEREAWGVLVGQRLEVPSWVASRT